MPWESKNIFGGAVLCFLCRGAGATKQLPTKSQNKLLRKSNNSKNKCRTCWADVLRMLCSRKGVLPNRQDDSTPKKHLGCIFSPCLRFKRAVCSVPGFEGTEQGSAAGAQPLDNPPTGGEHVLNRSAYA